jgi:hypothetical protein
VKKIFLILLFIPWIAAAEDSTFTIQKGVWDIGMFTGGGTQIHGGTTDDTQLWLTGVRFGKVLTGSEGHGSFEYAVEAIPAFVVFQDEIVYGVDITPLLLKWNFSSHSRIIPYFEIGAGLLYTSDNVPERTSVINFTPQTGFGVHVFTHEKQAISFTFKYMHISNGGLESPNPGINSLQFLIGYNWFH